MSARWLGSLVLGVWVLSCTAGALAQRAPAPVDELSPSDSGMEVLPGYPQPADVDGSGPAEPQFREAPPVAPTADVVPQAAPVAAPPAFEPPPATPRMQNGVAYATGGVGASEREDLARIKSEYNLHLMFAMTGSGEYLANVGVQIEDAGGNRVLSAVAQGPLFYVRLLPGLYRVSIDNAGSVQTQQILIPETGAVSHSFYWTGYQ